MISFSEFLKTQAPAARQGFVMEDSGGFSAPVTINNSMDIIDDPVFQHVCQIIKDAGADDNALMAFNPNETSKNFRTFKVPRGIWPAVDTVLAQIDGAKVKDGTQPYIDIPINNANIDWIRLIPGNGSIGRDGTKRTNQGLSYESTLVGYIQDYLDNGTIADDIKDLVKLVPDIQKVEHDGGKCTKRPLSTYGNHFAPFHNPSYDIGQMVTDITVRNSKNEPTYISVKYGDKVSVVNTSILKLLDVNDFKTGKASKKTADNLGKLLASFGIDVNKFVESIHCNLTKCNKAKEIVNNPEFDRNAVEDFLKASFGNGYIYFHKIGRKVHVLKMDKAMMEKIAKVKKVTVVYGNKDAREVDAKIETAGAFIEVRIRDRHKKGYPDSCNVDYKLKV